MEISNSALVSLKMTPAFGYWDSMDSRVADGNTLGAAQACDQFRLIQQRRNAVVALVDLTSTNSSPFTPIHSGLYTYTCTAHKSCWQIYNF